MKHKKIILTSLIITVLYLTTALIYFFGGFTNPISENSFRQVFETVFTMPAIIFFGVGFGSGGNWAYLALLIEFLILWLLFMGLTYIYYLIRNEKQKRKPTA